MSYTCSFKIFRQNLPPALKKLSGKRRPSVVTVELSDGPCEVATENYQVENLVSLGQEVGRFSFPWQSSDSEWNPRDLVVFNAPVLSLRKFGRRVSSPDNFVFHVGRVPEQIQRTLLSLLDRKADPKTVAEVLAVAIDISLGAS